MSPFSSDSRTLLSICALLPSKYARRISSLGRSLNPSSAVLSRRENFVPTRYWVSMLKYSNTGEKRISISRVHDRLLRPSNANPHKAPTLAPSAINSASSAHYRPYMKEQAIRSREPWVSIATVHPSSSTKQWRSDGYLMRRCTLIAHKVRIFQVIRGVSPT